MSKKKSCFSIVFKNVNNLPEISGFLWRSYRIPIAFIWYSYRIPMAFL